MLSGYPFRMAQATQQSLGTFLTLIENMRQVPHPAGTRLAVACGSQVGSHKLHLPRA